ncbi:hypothetical protein Golob_006423 [Gossypium lobatum]|uniref:Uncharacterized protein n=1 Tax=Gossypium lobatum TaxID=34289 RepID=A0A7J8MW61_9ROSI|nr:hypothetical protein [Gossypium lobatum]
MAYPPIGSCCTECYHGIGGGPCYYGGPPPPLRPCYGTYGRPVYDSWGGGGGYSYCYTSRGECFSDENPNASDLCFVGKLLSQRVINFATMVTTRLSLWKPLQGASIKSIGDAELYLIPFSHMIDMEEIIFGGTWPPYSSAFKRGKYEGCGILVHRFLGSCTRLAAEDCFRKSSEESRECNGKVLRF